MKKILLLLLAPLALFAKLNIALSYPYIGAITKTIGGDEVDVVVLAQGSFDPHFITPKPSLIAKLRAADGLIINGASLEIGWIPPLLSRSANTKLSTNMLDLSKGIALIDIPKVVDRKDGDVHPEGNPHFHLNPANIPLIAKNIKDFLSKLDAKNAKLYEANYQNFKASWEKNLLRWDEMMSQKAGMKVIQYHNVLGYFLDHYGIKNIATIEPLAGIAPSSKHTLELLELIKEQKPCCILHDVYHSTKTADFIAQKSGIKVILMPHDIGSLQNITNLEALFEYLCSAIK